jgi:hypothetical protein
VLGALRGTIKKLPSEDSNDPKDGLLVYEKDGVHSEVSFAMSDVNEYITSLSVGDQVRSGFCLRSLIFSISCCTAA